MAGVQPAFQREGMGSWNGNENDGQKVFILADSRAAIAAAVRRADKMGNARSRHLQKIVNEIAEIREGGRGGKIGWIFCLFLFSTRAQDIPIARPKRNDATYL